MRTKYRNRGSVHDRSRFPKTKKKNAQSTISESDLIRSIEYSKQSKIRQVQAVEYEAIHSFEDFQINYQLKKNISNKGYTTPTPIQDQAIPSILAGRDIIGIANTGTGKTAAFLVPLIEKVSKDRKQKVLIVAPTRELAEQINNEFKDLSKNLSIYSAILIGGQGYSRQIRELKRQPNFVIGTPGRIKDMMEKHILTFDDINNVVLDETDRMVDIGFIKEIKYFISLLPKERQSLFFSATVSEKVTEIINSFVQNAVTVSVKKRDTVENIYQDYIKITGKQLKIDQLHSLLVRKEFSKVIVFGNTKWGVQKLSNELVKRGFKADAIHGNKKQSQRHTILEKFKKDEVNILLATDVAARGLDINGVTHVINYDLPKTYDDYIHRIGRTGRANKAGVALTFIAP
jgi:superfamily II DNA/RNA helicase